MDRFIQRRNEEPELKNKNRMTDEQRVLLRDAAIFAFKLWLDGIKDFVLAVGGLAAAGFDFLRGRGPNGYLFYRVMRFGQKVDAVLDVYGKFELPAAEAEPGRKPIK
jgi:hypothetical protein